MNVKSGIEGWPESPGNAVRAVFRGGRAALTAVSAVNAARHVLPSDRSALTAVAL